MYQHITMLQKITQSFSFHYRVTNNCFFLLYKASKNTFETLVLAFFHSSFVYNCIIEFHHPIINLGVFGKIMTIHLRSI